jgi:formate hydrogenlyase subunit 6/NADH:ubiquinone oxidoreductase subunit I
MAFCATCAKVCSPLLLKKVHEVDFHSMKREEFL